MHSTAPPEQVALAQGPRTLATGLILLHFFALSVAVISNVAPSNLERKLRRVPGVRPYLQLLGMDVSYQFHFTYFEPEDFDHFLSADFQLADGTTSTVELPQPYVWPGHRYRRYERLASRIAALEEEGAESGLTRAVTSRLAREAGDVRSGTIRCPRPRVERMEQDGAYVWADRDQPYREAFYRGGFEAHLVRFRDRIELMQAAPAGETAPAPSLE